MEENKIMHDEFQHGYDWDDLFEKELENDVPLEEDFFKDELDSPENQNDWISDDS